MGADQPVGGEAADEERREQIPEGAGLRGFDEMPAWARNASYNKYREGWLKTSAPQEFLDELEDSLADERTIAEVWQEDNRPVGLLWVTFSDLYNETVTFAQLRSSR